MWHLATITTFSSNILSVGRMKLKMPSSKTSSIVLLHMRSTLENKLSLFEVTAGRPIHLSPVTLDSLVIKGGESLLCQGLIEAVSKTHFWVKQSFHSTRRMTFPTTESSLEILCLVECCKGLFQVCCVLKASDWFGKEWSSHLDIQWVAPKWDPVPICD